MTYHRTDIRRDLAAAAVLMMAALLTRAACIYSGGMSEPDSVVIAAGMARMVEGGSLSDCMLYGRYLNPGIYIMFRLIHPLFVGTAADTITFLNLLGVLSSTALTALLYMLFRRIFGRTTAACCTLITIFSPVFWETGTCFHPVVPALVLLAGAILLFDRISLTPGGVIAFLAVAALASSATVVRNEILLAAPSLVAASALSSSPRRSTGLAILISAVSGLAFIAVVRAVSGNDPGGLSGFSAGFLRGLLGSISLEGLARTVPWAVMAIGTATVYLAVRGILTCLKKQRSADTGGRKCIVDMLPALLWAAPPLIIWLLWPVPVMRHYFIVVPAIAYIVGATILTGRRKRAAAFITAAVIIMNLGVPEILYRAYNAAYPHSAKEPHGTFFYRHSRVEDRIKRYCALQEQISKCADGRQGKGHRCVILPVNWEIYGYAIYCLAGRAEPSGSMDDPATGIVTHAFETDSSTIKLVLSGRFDLDEISEETLLEIGRSSGPGCTVHLPREIKETSAPRLPASVEIAVY